MVTLGSDWLQVSQKEIICGKWWRRWESCSHVLSGVRFQVTGSSMSGHRQERLIPDDSWDHPYWKFSFSSRSEPPIIMARPGTFCPSLPLMKTNERRSHHGASGVHGTTHLSLQSHDHEKKMGSYIWAIWYVGLRFPLIKHPQTLTYANTYTYIHTRIHLLNIVHTLHTHILYILTSNLSSLFFVVLCNSSNRMCKSRV